MVSRIHSLAIRRALGANRVIDYTEADFTQGDARYDLIIDNAVNHSIEEYGRMLAPHGSVGVVGASSARWLGR